ncbi:hypothetical protein niasHT_016415 [Heterodera trifolii]|uniref:Uncharacterized protein n=1 Tax=Heterodera trifolii TaxID=157864 RepID=A0ABD2LJ55_9BILA
MCANIGYLLSKKKQHWPLSSLTSSIDRLTICCCNFCLACAIVLKASPIPTIILIGKFIVCFLNGTKNDKAAKAEWPTENFEKKG